MTFLFICIKLLYTLATHSRTKCRELRTKIRLRGATYFMKWKFMRVVKNQESTNRELFWPILKVFKNRYWLWLPKLEADWICQMQKLYIQGNHFFLKLKSKNLQIRYNLGGWKNQSKKFQQLISASAIGRLPIFFMTKQSALPIVKNSQ